MLLTARVPIAIGVAIARFVLDLEIGAHTARGLVEIFGQYKIVSLYSYVYHFALVILIAHIYQFQFQFQLTLK